ncbi:Zinc finger, CCHC-type [Penicillium occitanis (nom. inval.)]|nr:Zinc finger, CCHC-type [Penicillium occitanis (nom. inval.)]PCH07746.1 hypothetical protein PENOC_017540 [Penicillium occitanis (nom. inval.)]
MAARPDITLYTAQTPNGIKISIALEELGLPYKVKKLEFSKNEQKEPWFLEINPNGRIPAITDTFTDGKTINIFESGSILQYLADNYDPENKISYPRGTREFYEQTNWLFYQNAGLGPMQGQANHFTRYAPERIEYGINRYQNETRRLYGVLDKHLSTSKSGYLVGDHISIADISHWGWIASAGWAGVDIEEFPHLKAWEEKLAAREGVEKGRHVPERHTIKEVLKDKDQIAKHSAHTLQWVQKGMADDAKNKFATEALLTLFKLSTDLPLLLSTPANLSPITVASIHVADASKMSWRNNQGITGSNNIPLGKRRFGGDDEGASEASTPTVAASENGATRGRSPTRADPPADGVKRRKKRNRWGDAQENKAAGLMGLPTMIMANFTNEQLEAYTLHLRIEEISQKLRINDVVPADGDRSPSPPPQYDNFGRRVNTREYRYRKRLEDERHKLVERAMKVIPNYHPPSDYRRPTKTQEKVYVPVNDYPEINFIGLLIGPRGNTLKTMEKESGAKIAIRGKGSVKEGKGRSDAAHTSNQEEDLHCLIMADTEEKVNKAKQLVHNVIETAASIPEGQNELKRNQLRELAALNGTLRDDENQACQNCGQIGHRKYDCPEQRNFTANIICRVCGNAGHMARDCPDRQRGTDWRNNGGYGGRGPQRAIGGGDAVDREMEQLMQELSGGGSGPNGEAPRRIEGGPGGYDQDSNYKPWQQRGPPAPVSDVAPWQQRGREQHGRRDDYEPRDHNDAAPWAQGRGGGGNYGYGSHHGNYSAPGAAPGGAAPWQQQAPPPPPGGQAGYGYGYSAFPPPPPAGGHGAPPGLSGAPPGLESMYYGGAAAPPPPPPGDGPPPPPPSDHPPPPPPPM